MAIKKKQLSKGGEIGEVQRRPHKLVSFAEKHVRLIAIFAVVVICVSLLWILFHKSSNQDRGLTTQQAYAQAFLSSDNSDKTKSDLVKKYSTQYTESLKNTIASNPDGWDKAKLDNAYATLLYADKIGAFAQASTILTQIDAAKSSGLNIDDNSYGVNQAIRNEIKNRTDERIKKAQDSAKVEFKL